MISFESKCYLLLKYEMKKSYKTIKETCESKNLSLVTFRTSFDVSLRSYRSFMRRYSTLYIWR